MPRAAGIVWTDGEGTTTFEAFGPDGNLYVASAYTGQVLHYDGSTGEFLGVFAEDIDNPIGLAFGPDGHLYVGSFDQASVLRFHGSTGKAIGVCIRDRLLQLAKRAELETPSLFLPAVPGLAAYREVNRAEQVGNEYPIGLKIWTANSRRWPAEDLNHYDARSQKLTRYGLT